MLLVSLLILFLFLGFFIGDCIQRESPALVAPMVVATFGVIVLGKMSGTNSPLALACFSALAVSMPLPLVLSALVRK